MKYLLILLLSLPISANPAEGVSDEVASVGLCITYFYQKAYKEGTGKEYWIALSAEIGLTVDEFAALCKIMLKTHKKRVAKQLKNSI